MSELEKMLQGKLYNANDAQLLQMRVKAKKICQELNQLAYDMKEERKQMLRKLLYQFPDTCYFELPFYCDYGVHISFGEYVYANHNLTILDGAKVTIGSHVYLAPNVSIYTAGHPIDYQEREKDMEYAFPVTLKDHVWIGGNTVINPGVTIGSDVVIGSGSVVTRDIPDHVVAAGNPCRVLRAITKEDKKRLL